jgi:hypothetical protein
MKIPPGFADEKSKSQTALYTYDDIKYKAKHGDLILWLQIIEYMESKKDACVIFVTDDQKEDWWWIVDNKTLGPRPELVSEMRQAAGTKLFYMYKSNQFLKYAKEYLGAKVSEESIGQVKEVAERVSAREIFRKEAEKAEYLAKAWILERFQGARVISTYAWPNLVIDAADSGELIGCEIKVQGSSRGTNYIGELMT